MEVLYRLEIRNGKKGVFAAQDIAVGSRVRKMVAGVNTQQINGQKAFQELLNTLKSDEDKRRWINQCYGLNETLHEFLGDSQHVQHGDSNAANIVRGKGKHN